MENKGNNPKQLLPIILLIGTLLYAKHTFFTFNKKIDISSIHSAKIIDSKPCTQDSVLLTISHEDQSIYTIKLPYTTQKNYNLYKDSQIIVEDTNINLPLTNEWSKYSTQDIQDFIKKVQQENE